MNFARRAKSLLVESSLFRNTQAGKLYKRRFIVAQFPAVDRRLSQLSSPLCTKYRDITKPLTLIELNDIKTGFKKLATYNDEDGGSVSSAEVPAVFGVMNYDATSDRVKEFQNFWDKQYGGRILFNEYVNLLKAMHDPANYATTLAVAYDLDKDGVISKEEFESLLKVCTAHDKRLEALTFEHFLRQADTITKDGEVNLLECIKWIQKYLEKTQ